MLYAIISEDIENSLESRKSARPAHLARLESLTKQGRLILAGPHPALDTDDPGEAGFSGSLVVAEFPSLAEAKSWAITWAFSKRDAPSSLSICYAMRASTSARRLPSTPH